MSEAPQETLRLFFAVSPDAQTRAQLADAALRLTANTQVLRVDPVAYHVTLAFVGAVPAAELPRLMQIGGAVRSAGWSLRFDAYEYWPKPAVIVAAARTIPTPLQALWHQLHHDLAEREWALAPKRLRPHVTLAKKVSQAPALPAMSPIHWPVRDFCLMQSHADRIPSAYTVVDTWSLLDSVEKQ